MRGRALSIAATAAAVVALSGAAFAGSDLNVGDRIRFIDQPGSPGGEFGVAKTNGTTQLGSELFRTFCVQRNEFLDFSVAGFFVQNISTSSVVAGASVLTPETAFLYTQFRQGALPGYDGSAAKANDLQAAIWYWEGESGGSNNAYAKYAKDAVDADSTVTSGNTFGDGNQWVGMGIGNVRIANLVWATTRSGFQAGSDAQDVLVLVPTPEAAGAGLSLLAALGVVGYVKRRRQADERC